VVNSAGDGEGDDPRAGGRFVEARRVQLTMAAGPGGDGDGVRLAARRAHVALPPDRITKAGLPTSGPWEIAESAPAVVRYS